MALAVMKQNDFQISRRSVFGLVLGGRISPDLDRVDKVQTAPIRGRAHINGSRVTIRGLLSGHQMVRLYPSCLCPSSASMCIAVACLSPSRLALTGRKGHRTPTGVFTVLQKDKDHVSSTYKGAKMPYMERLTWSGIALHAGNLPGYPASHGCIRLPLDFAHKLFSISHLGMVVILADATQNPPKSSIQVFFCRPTPKKRRCSMWQRYQRKSVHRRPVMKPRIVPQKSSSASLTSPSPF